MLGYLGNGDDIAGMQGNSARGVRDAIAVARATAGDIPQVTWGDGAGLHPASSASSSSSYAGCPGVGNGVVPQEEGTSLGAALLSPPAAMPRVVFPCLQLPSPSFRALPWGWQDPTLGSSTPGMPLDQSQSLLFPPRAQKHQGCPKISLQAPHFPGFKSQLLVPTGDAPP